MKVAWKVEQMVAVWAGNSAVRLAGQWDLMTVEWSADVMVEM